MLELDLDTKLDWYKRGKQTKTEFIENVRCDPGSLCFIVYLNFSNLTFTDKRQPCETPKMCSQWFMRFCFSLITTWIHDIMYHWQKNSCGRLLKFCGCMWTFVSLRLNILDLFWWSERHTFAVGKRFVIVREVNFPGTISMLNTLLCGCRWIFEKLTFSWLWCFSDVLLLISSVSAQFSITRCVTRNPHWPDLCWCFSLCPEDISSCFLWALMFPSSNLHKWTYYIIQSAQLWHET